MDAHFSFVGAIIYLSSYNLHDCTFNVFLMNSIPNHIFTLIALYAYNVCINTIKVTKNSIAYVKYFNSTATDFVTFGTSLSRFK